MMARAEAEKAECPYLVMGLFAAHPKSEYDEDNTYCQADKCPKWINAYLGSEDLPCPKPCERKSPPYCNECPFRYGRCSG